MPDCEIKPNGTLPIQFSVMLKNRAGALSSLVRLLRSENIEVIGLSIQDSRDAAVTRLVVSDPDTTMRIFMEKGIPTHHFRNCRHRSQGVRSWSRRGP